MTLGRIKLIVALTAISFFKGCLLIDNSMKCQETFQQISDSSDVLCVRLYEEPKSWTEAHKTCRQQSSYLLAYPHMPKSGSELFNYFKFSHAYVEAIWIGLRRKGNALYYQWFGETPAVETGYKSNCNSNAIKEWGRDWWTGNPQKDCVALNIENGARVTVDCGPKNLRPFACVNKAFPANLTYETPACKDGRYSPIKNKCIVPITPKTKLEIQQESHTKTKLEIQQDRELDIKVVVRPRNNQESAITNNYLPEFSELILECIVLLSNSQKLNTTSVPKMNYFWIKDDVYLRDEKGKSQIDPNGAYDERKRLGTKDTNNNNRQGNYQCEVQIPGVEKSFTSERIVAAHLDVTTYLLFLSGYNPLKHDSSCLFTAYQFIQNVEKNVSAILNIIKRNRKLSSLFGSEITTTKVNSRGIQLDNQGPRNLNGTMFFSLTMFINQPTRKDDETWETFQQLENVMSERNIRLFPTLTCWKTTTHLDNGTKLKWPSAFHGENVCSAPLCITSEGKIAKRRCIGSFTEGASWEPFDESVCSEIKISDECDESRDETPRNRSLKILAKETYDENNKSNVIEELKNFTEMSLKRISSTKPEEEAENIEHIAQILEKLTNFSTFNYNEIHTMVSTLDDVMQFPDNVLTSARRNSNAPERVVTAFENLLLKSDTQENNLQTYEMSNVAAIAINMTQKSNNFIYGAGIGHNMSSHLFIEEILSEDKEINHNWKAAAILPKNMIEQQIQEGGLKIAIIMYTTGKLLQSSHNTLQSPIISVATNPGNMKNLNPPAQIILDNVGLSKSKNKKLKCVYWDTKKENITEKLETGDINGWSTQGCIYNGTRTGKHICLCNHLTPFAVVLVPDLNKELKVHIIILSAITYVGCILSISALLLTVLTYALIKKWRKGNLSHALCNLSLALLGMMITFSAGIDQTGYEPSCILVAVLLHYFTLVAFAWMLVEAIIQYLRLVKVIGTYIPHFIRKAIICAWGIPILVVATVLGIDYKLYIREDYCWMKTKVLYFALILPIGLVFVVNVIIFIKIIYSITWGRQTGLRVNQSEKKLIMTKIRASVSMAFLLGLTWIFGFLSLGGAQIFFSYLFSIFATLQGFFIFIFMVAGEKSFKEMVRNIFCKKLKGSDAASFQLSRETSTNTKEQVL